VSVIEPLRVVDGGYAAMYVPTPEEDEAVRSSVRAAVTAQLRRYGGTATPQIRTGPAASEIVNAARESDADLIVLGIGRHNFLDRALGSETALQVVQLASMPVLAVPTSMTSLPRRVVAAVDFTSTSVSAVKECARWLLKGDSIRLVHVAGPWHGDLPLEERISAENILNAICQHIDVADGVRIDFIVLEGVPPERLLEVAATENADLLALGSHGYGFWKRLTIGSVASKIIRLSPIAVLVMPLGAVSKNEHLLSSVRGSMANV
jgi:nucleotide-binding universal stress UspA family protein